MTECSLWFMSQNHVNTCHWTWLHFMKSIGKKLIFIDTFYFVKKSSEQWKIFFSECSSILLIKNCFIDFMKYFLITYEIVIEQTTQYQQLEFAKFQIYLIQESKPIKIHKISQVFSNQHSSYIFIVLVFSLKTRNFFNFFIFMIFVKHFISFIESFCCWFLLSK